MDDQTQGIGDQPVSEDEMAAVDQAASQFGSVVQPSADGDEAPVQPDNSPSAVIEPSAQVAPATDTPIADALAPDQTGDPAADQPAEDTNPAAPTIDNASRSVIGPMAPKTGTPPDEGAAADDSTDDQTPEPVVAPAEDETPTPAPVADDEVPEPTPEPVGDDEVPQPTNDPQDDTTIEPVEHPPLPGNADTGDGSDDELLDVKQQALQELTPLVDTLDLPPEERFDTLMMIIRASDDKSLVKPAHDAANEITNQDKKARALLDIVNEVNYLTQNGPESQQVAPES